VFYDYEKKLINKFHYSIKHIETDVLKLLLCMVDTIALKFHKLLALIFAIFDIIIQRAVGYGPCYLMKNTSIITALYNRSRKKTFFLKQCV
jgi:hypothetical protein